MIHATFPHAPKHFEEMTDAFDYCREINKPIHVCVDQKIVKLFPSGRAEETGKTCSTVVAS